MQAHQQKRLTVTLIVISFLFLALHFYFSRHMPIRIWDEAIYSNNAVEMRMHGNLLVLQNNGHPSLYNTKPPLAIWLQSLSMFFFGINEFALRLPSYVASFVTISSLIIFLGYYNKKPWARIVATAVMLSSAGYLGDHIGATADLDAVTACLVTLFTLNSLRLCLDNRIKIDRTIWLSAALFMAAFFAKSATVFLVLPGVFLSLLYSGKWKEIFLRRSIMFGIIAVAGFIVGYYFLLDSLSPGYLNTVWFSEVQRFYKNVMPWHNQAADYYFLVLGKAYTPWCYFILPAFIVILSGKNTIARTLGVMATICATSFCILITIPSTKLAWYLAPAYPLFALIIASGTSELFNWIQARSGLIAIATKMTFLLYALVLSCAILKQRTVVDLDPLEREGNFLKMTASRNEVSHSTIFMVAEHPEHYDQVNFYRKKFEIEGNRHHLLTHSLEALGHMDTILVCQQTLKDSISRHFAVDTILRSGDCLLLKIR